MDAASDAAYAVNSAFAWACDKAAEDPEITDNQIRDLWIATIKVLRCFSKL
jgi:hypothetical protein